MQKLSITCSNESLLFRHCLLFPVCSISLAHVSEHVSWLYRDHVSMSPLGCHNTNWAMVCATNGDYVDIECLCRKWGGGGGGRDAESRSCTNCSHSDIVRPCLEWITDNPNSPMAPAIKGANMDIVHMNGASPIPQRVTTWTSLKMNFTVFNGGFRTAGLLP